MRWTQLSSLLVVLTAVKLVFTNTQGQVSFSNGPVLGLGALSTEFTTLRHPLYAQYLVRIAHAPGFCDPTVNAYTGYIDIGVKHLFFYFFESRSNPAVDDVVMWINGGPGGSSSLGMLMELGPCNIDGPNGTSFNPHGWNKYANTIFIDQPVNVGFSYSEHGIVSSTEDAAVDIAAFFTILSLSFEQFRGRRLHMAGESYGGHYIPVFASALADQNERLLSHGYEPVNLQSILLGNGLSTFKGMFRGYHDMLCTNASGLKPPNSISDCVRMKQVLLRCEPMFKRDCQDTQDVMACGATLNFCQSQLIEPFLETNTNIYDLSKNCYGEDARDALCYSETIDIAAYLNNASTRALLHIDPLPEEFAVANFTVNTLFAMGGDQQVDVTPYIEGLLERNIRVLVYVGAYDLACNWVGNYAMTKGLEWHGRRAYLKAPEEDWIVDGKVAGMKKTSKKLTFLKIDAAGHMVPHDKPYEAAEMLRLWLKNEI